MSSRARRLAEQRRAERRRWLALTGMGAASIVALVLLVIVVSGGGGDDPSSPTATGTVSMTEMAFAPDPIEGDAGEAVLRVVNDGLVAHSLVIPALGKGTPDLKPGQELTIDLTEAAPGEYEAFCDVPGHREAGMTTTLVLR